MGVNFNNQSTKSLVVRTLSIVDWLCREANDVVGNYHCLDCNKTYPHSRQRVMLMFCMYCIIRPICLLLPPWDPCFTAVLYCDQPFIVVTFVSVPLIQRLSEHMAVPTCAFVLVHPGDTACTPHWVLLLLSPPHNPCTICYYQF